MTRGENDEREGGKRDGERDGVVDDVVRICVVWRVLGCVTMSVRNMLYMLAI